MEAQLDKDEQGRWLREISAVIREGQRQDHEIELLRRRLRSLGYKEPLDAGTMVVLAIAGWMAYYGCYAFLKTRMDEGLGALISVIVGINVAAWFYRWTNRNRDAEAESVRAMRSEEPRGLYHFRSTTVWSERHAQGLSRFHLKTWEG